MQDGEFTAGSAEYLVQFLHPQKILGLPAAGGPLDEVSSTCFGLSADDVAQVRERCAARVRAAAAELLAEPALADAVARLPFAPGRRVIAFGDSLTDDLQSWAALLAALLAQARPGDAIEVVNHGRSSDTTTDLLQRFPSVAAERPDWIVVLAGVNDAKHMRLAPRVPLVSPAETRRNVEALAQMASAVGARLLWMVPPRFDAERLAASPFMSAAPMSWDAADVAAVRETLLGACEGALDLDAAFAAGGAPAGLRLDDGLHPSLAGQQAIVRALCRRLADAGAGAGTGAGVGAGSGTGA